MTPISFDNVALTPAVVTRWQQETEHAIAQCRSAGITTRPGSESLHVLDNGRLQLTTDAAPGCVIVLYAEPGEWSRIDSN